MPFADGKSFTELLFAPAEAPVIEEPPTDIDNKPASIDPVDPDDLDMDPDDDEDDEEVNPAGYSTYATSAYDDFIVWQTPTRSSITYPWDEHV